MDDSMALDGPGVPPHRFPSVAMPSRTLFVPCSLADRNMKLFESGDYHDFIIKCGTQDFKVHRNIICPQSTVLRTLCDPSWKEGNEGFATLSEQEPEVVALALEFLYSGNYKTACTCTELLPPMQKTKHCLECVHCQKGSLMMDVRVYILGDYLDISDLKVLALSRSEHILQHHFQAAPFVDAIAEALSNTKHDDSGLRRQILRSCCEKHELIKIESDLWRLLMEHEPMAWTMGIENQIQRGALYKQISDGFCTKMELSRELEHRKKDVQRAHENLAAAVKLVNGKNSCRNDNCSKEFGANLETYANGYIKGLRCSRCRCRHNHED